MEELFEMQDELANLLSWFKKYDVQCMQYARDIRLNGSSEIDIASLDNQAEINKARITELRALIQNAINDKIMH